MSKQNDISINNMFGKLEKTINQGEVKEPAKKQDVKKPSETVVDEKKITSNKVIKNTSNKVIKNISNKDGVSIKKTITVNAELWENMEIYMKVKGVKQIDFINSLFEQVTEENQEMIETYKKFLKKINKGLD